MATNSCLLLPILFLLLLSKICTTFQLSTIQSTYPIDSRRIKKRIFENTIKLHSSINDQNRSASSKERRDEEKRRMDRKKDVVLGKTSAIDGETNFSLDPTATEEQYLKQASKVEQEVFFQTELGLTELRNLCLEKSSKAFQRVFELRPHAYCWQAGIVNFYLGDCIGAAEIFAKSACTYETKFGLPGSEERIWRDACELKYLNDPSNKKQKPSKEMFKQVEETDEDCMDETRKVIRLAKDLFAASVNNDYSKLILSKAKLRAIGGTFGKNDKISDQKMWRVNSWFYLGLHYDAFGEYKESKKCMKMALRLCPSNGNGSDIIQILPLLHMSVRDWFDDDEFNIIDGNSHEKENSEKEKVDTPSGVTVDPIIVLSIRDSISKMKYDDLKNTLRIRGVSHTGPKEKLQTRLFNSLVGDVGLQ